MNISPRRAVSVLLAMVPMSVIMAIIIMLYFFIPAYLSQHINFGYPYNYQITLFVYSLMWVEIIIDAYIAIKVFYQLPVKLLEDSKRPHIVAILCMIFSYLYSIYAFSIAYSYMSNLWPNSFNNVDPEDNPIPLSIIDSLYFSVITGTSIGYGDIVPTAVGTKITVMAQALISLAYIIFVFSSCSTYLRERIKS